MTDADWPSIEDGFKQNVSLRKLAGLYGASPATIMRKAREMGWVKAPSIAEEVADQAEDAALIDDALNTLREANADPEITADDLTRDEVLRAALARAVEVLRAEKVAIAQLRMASDELGGMLLRHLALIKKQSTRKLKAREVKELNTLTGVLGNPLVQLRTLSLSASRIVPLERLVHAMQPGMKEGGGAADKKARQQRRDIGDVLDGLAAAVSAPSSEAVH